VSAPPNIQLLTTGGLVLATLFLGVRASSSVSGALGQESTSVTSASAALAGGTPSGEGGQALDGATENLVRDPFAFPTPKRRPAPPRRHAPKKPEPVPTLRALLYDTVAPGVRIMVKGTRSDWLQKGDAFLGWSVVDITPDSATLNDGKRTVVVRSIQEH